MDLWALGFWGSLDGRGRRHHLQVSDGAFVKTSSGRWAGRSSALSYLLLLLVLQFLVGFPKLFSEPGDFGLEGMRETRLSDTGGRSPSGRLCPRTHPGPVVGVAWRAPDRSAARTHLERVHCSLVFSSTVDFVYSVPQVFKRLVEEGQLQRPQMFFDQLLYNLRRESGQINE